MTTPNEQQPIDPQTSETTPRPTTATGQAVDAAVRTTTGLVERAATTTTGAVDRAAGVVKQAEQGLKDGSRAALDLGRDVLRASLGAASAAREEGGKLIGSLVERGAAVEARTVDQVKEQVQTVRADLDERRQGLTQRVEQVTETVTSRVSETVGSLESTIKAPVAGAMRRLGVPTRDELQELSSSVAALSAKVEALIARLDAAPAAQGGSPEQQDGVAAV